MRTWKDRPAGATVPVQLPQEELRGPHACRAGQQCRLEAAPGRPCSTLVAWVPCVLSELGRSAGEPISEGLERGARDRGGHRLILGPSPDLAGVLVMSDHYPRSSVVSSAPAPEQELKLGAPPPER